jgi:EpsD family peptidyl-prolyl cis-trans isomerase
VEGGFVNKLGAAAIIGICLFAPLGCSRNAGQEQEPAGQVVAHVGNEVLTSLELDHELRLANIPVEKRKDPAILKQMLAELTLRKYLVEQAVALKLDQEPNVSLDITRSREQVLANAFMARKAASVSITASEVDQFIAQNPAKFANRQVLTIDQMRFALGPNIQDVIAANQAAKSLDEIDGKLTSMGIPHNRSEGQLSQGDLPPDLAKALQSRKADEIFFARLGPSGIYFKVKSEKMLPFEGAAATNFSRQSLRADAMKANVAAASAAARRETVYSGEYAKIMSTTNPAASGAASIATSEGASAAAPAAPTEATAPSNN